jgi:VWFA-related protein
MRCASTSRNRAAAGTCLVLAATLAGLLGDASWGTAAQTPDSPATLPQGGTFRSEVDLVALHVTVVDGRQRFVPNLLAEDFGVYDEGAKQQVMLFASAMAPLDLMVLLDTSGSMGASLALAKDAAIRLVRTLKEGDRGAVVTFSDGVRFAQPLTDDRARLESALRAPSASGETALYESVYIALRELRRERPVDDMPRRQAIVVLSDGDDNRSRVSFDDVLDEARRSAVTIFTIVPAPVTGVVPTNSFGQRLWFDMRRLADETGGRAFAPVKVEDLSSVYKDVATELGQQYWLAYVPPPPVNGQEFRRVSVRVETRSGLRARTRVGYYTTPLAATPSARQAAP